MASQTEIESGSSNRAINPANDINQTPPNPATTNMAPKTQQTRQFEQMIGLFSQIAVATLLMMWGVINLVFNLFSFRRLPAENMPEFTEMAIGATMIAITGLLPFLIGLIWLWKLMDKKPEKP